MRDKPLLALRILAHVGALVPLGLVIYLYQTGGLSANPIEDITHRTGKAALWLLILTLAVTPLVRITGQNRFIQIRRSLGLYCFFYATLHFLVFIWLDYGLDVALITDGVYKKRFVLVGFSALLLLTPLAATSNRWSMRKLGVRWKRLHRLIYPAALLAAVHFVWLVKQGVIEPYYYAAAIVALLAFRLLPAR